MLQCKENYFNSMLKFISQDQRNEIEKLHVIEYQALSEEVEKLHIRMQELAVEITKDKDNIKKRIQQQQQQQQEKEKQ
eukprot:UN00862